MRVHDPDRLRRRREGQPRTVAQKRRVQHFVVASTQSMSRLLQSHAIDEAHASIMTRHDEVVFEARETFQRARRRGLFVVGSVYLPVRVPPSPHDTIRTSRRELPPSVVGRRQQCQSFEVLFTGNGDLIHSIPHGQRRVARGEGQRPIIRIPRPGQPAHACYGRLERHRCNLRRTFQIPHMHVESPRGREDQREGVVFYGSQNAAASGREAVRRREVPSGIKNAARAVC
mmetsp:Transcript_2313/g.6470  ORF Transcript_2313/g.6470 Transcript_2313/m.6470 type:complete len:229 (+) Transcript_2313:1415-2101(+)